MQSVSRTLADVALQADAIARGDYSAEIAPRSAQDRLGQALFEMTQALHDGGGVCDAIAVGDFSTKVEMKGDQDQRGRAVNQMVDNFAEIDGVP